MGYLTGTSTLPADRVDSKTSDGSVQTMDAAYANSVKAAVAEVLAELGIRPLENILPNTQWQIATAIGSNTQMNVQGTGTESPIAVTSYTTGANTVVALTSNTGNLAVGDLVAFQSPADANLRLTTMRVTAVVANTSFTVVMPRNLTASASSACNVVITNVGGSSSVGVGDAFDGWSKSTTAQVWREYHSANVLAGSKYSAGYKKGSASSETMSWSPSSADASKYAGRKLVFGAYVRQKVKGGSGTWRAYISSNGTGGTTTYSASSANTAYDWKEVAYTVPSDATTLSLGISFDGASGDVYYVSQPMGGFGTYLGAGAYRQPFNEKLIPKVKMSPLSYIGASVTMPSSLNGSDYNCPVDFYAETNGAVAPTVKRIYMQLEGKGTAGQSLCLRDVVSAPVRYAIVNYAQVTGVMLSQAGLVTLDGSGYAVLYSNTSASAWTSVSMDVSGYDL